jgi:hypothetical protein
VSIRAHHAEDDVAGIDEQARLDQIPVDRVASGAAAGLDLERIPRSS